MGTILKGMSRVRWHEYRSATAVPGALSRIAWGDARTSEDALSDLGLWLAELAVFDATVAAVPFLWELAETGAATCRPGVIEVLLAVLEHGNPPRSGVQWDAHQAVLSGRTVADRLTWDSDPPVRAAARDLVTAIDNHRCETCRPA